MLIKLESISIVLILIAVLFTALPMNVSAEETSEANFEPALDFFPDPIHDWVDEGIGTFFELENSDYLNIKITSSKLVHVFLESFPRVVSYTIEAINSDISTILTLNGFETGKTYYRYQDGYLQEDFSPDISGSFSYTQDLSIPHHVFFQEERSTIYIKDDSTGGDGHLIGNWDWSSKTLTLTTDVYETIVIDGNGITLNGAGYSIIGPGASSWPYTYGIYISGKTSNTIKDIIINGFTIGVGLYYSNNNVFNGILLSSLRYGVSLSVSNSNTIIGNTIQNVDVGIYISYGCNSNIVGENIISSNGSVGISLQYGNDNSVIDNSISNCSSGLSVALITGSNTISGNKFSDNNFGIDIFWVRRFSIIGNNFTNNKIGIRLSSAEDFTVIYNTITSEDIGIEIRYCQNLILTNNVLTGHGIHFEGYSLEHWNTHIIDTSNTIDGKPVYYLKNIDGGIIPQGAGQVILANCQNVIVENQDVGGGLSGIYIGHGSKNKIQNNTVSNSMYGISLSNSGGNTICDNIITGITTNSYYYISPTNINLYYSNKNKISRNNILNGNIGIYVERSNDNIISGNTIIDYSNNGIYFNKINDENLISANSIYGGNIGIKLYEYTTNSIISGNTISDNTGCGLYLDYHTVSTIFYNNFVNNTNHFLREGTKNTWDNGIDKGNYWDDYSGLDNGANGRIPGDGIGDTDIPHLGVDNYPLMTSWIIPVESPIAEAGGPYTVDEGIALILDGSGTYDPADSVVFSWDLDNDGAYDDASGPSPSYTNYQQGTYMVGLQVFDGGLFFDYDTATVTVVNVCPMADAGGPYFVTEGVMINLDGTGSYDTADTLTYEWDLDNDGEYDNTETNPFYFGTDDGDYTVNLRVFDGDCYDIDSTTVSVTNAAPKSRLLGGLEVSENYILATTFFGTSYYIELNGDGTFNDPQYIDDKGSGGFGAGIGDFDNDNDLDALIGDGYNTWYYEKIGDGNNFASGVPIDSTRHPYRCDYAEADYNNDGNLDAIMADYRLNYYTIYLGNGDGTFSIDTLNGPYFIVGLDSADFNNDGNMDFVGASRANSGAFIYLGNGDGTFQLPIQINIGSSFSISAGDFDNDGKADLIFGYESKFYPGNGDGTFNNPIYNGFFAISIAESDINNDGNLDLVYSDGYSLYYRTGNGDGTFGFVSNIPIANYFYGIATVNIDPPILELNEGEVEYFSAGFSDQGYLDTHTATWDWGDDTAPTEGSIIEENEHPLSTGEVSGSHAYGDNSEYIISLTVIDDDGDQAVTMGYVNVMNVPPIADTGGSYIVSEGDDFAFDGTSTYDPGFLDVLTYIWDFGDGSDPVSGVNLQEPTHTYIEDGEYTITLTVTDDDGGFDSTSATVTVINAAPIIDEPLSLPTDPVDIDNVVELTAMFSDQGILDTHTAEIDWGDDVSTAGTVTEISGSGVGAIAGSHYYSEPGVYMVTLTVTDNDGGSSFVEHRYVVVYDPEGGFVTGGGWIDSPEGAYTPDSTLSGRVVFGFFSKYQKGASEPVGNTHFRFITANMDFKSSDYDWLVVAGSKAQFKGTGTINGDGVYGFMITATDGDKNGGTDPDMFRIKIWDKTTDEVIYDNNLGAEDNAEAATEIGAGKITVQ
jgi:parallel beta-helix repeat protein